MSVRVLPFLLLSACATAQDLRLPPRPASAPTGSQMPARIRNLSVGDREELLWHEITAGNVPGFLRRFVPVTVTATIQGRLRTATFHVAPDYLGVGSDADWFRMPMTPVLGQQLADRLGCVLPTRRMVDAIWAHAPVKLSPYPFSPTQYNILSPDLFYRHHRQIETQRAGRPQSQMVAGIKKDVVCSALIAAWPNRVVIYGWHYVNGTPIQPLSKVHVNYYADYSHGIRLVRETMTVDGVPTTVTAVLADPQLHVLLSDEGPIPSPSYPAPQPSETFPFRDAFPAGGPQLGSWRAKFATPSIVPTTPSPLGGDGFALRVMDPAGGTDSVRLSAGDVADQAVQAVLFCEYRPGLSGDGFERIGIFARDAAQGAFDGTLSQNGACYALAWDSGDGRLWCMRASGGVLTDLNPQPVHLRSTAWRIFRIEARGSELTFLVDGTPVLRTVDATFPGGEFGIGYHEYFATNSNMRGTRADRFWADVPDAFALYLDSIGGRLSIDVERGVPGDVYFTPATLRAGGYPNGWFFGIDPTLGELLSLAGSGHPAFIGLLDGAGNARYTAAGVPAGLTLYAVSLELDRGLRFLQASPPVQHLTR